MKTCGSAQIVILLAILLGGCGNKGPLVMPQSIDTEAKPLSDEQAIVSVEDKKEQKP